MAELYPIIHNTHHIFFLHWSVNGHRLLHILTIMLWTVRCMLSFFISVFTFFGHILKSGLAGSYGNSIVPFWESHTLSPQWWHHLHSDQFVVFDDNHSDRCQNYSLILSHLYLSTLIARCWPPFPMSVGHLDIFFRKLSIQSSVHCGAICFWCWLKLFWMSSLLIYHLQVFSPIQYNCLFHNL